MAAKKSQAVDAPIVRVTVHRNGALVTRRGTAASADVEVRGLSLLLSSDSLRVRPANGTVRDLEELCVLDAETAPPRSDEAAVREAGREVRRLYEEAENLGERIGHYQNLSPLSAGKTPSRNMPDARVWIALHDFAGERRRALEERRREVVRQGEDAKRRLMELQRADRGDRRPPRFTRGVRFKLDGGGRFELEYWIPAARWVPTYTLAIDGGQACLTVGALVAQASGEDWDGVALRLATADLARETTLPELTSWRLGRVQPRRPAFRELPKGLDDLFSGYDRKPAAPPAASPGVAAGAPRMAALAEPVAEAAFGVGMAGGGMVFDGEDQDDTGMLLEVPAEEALMDEHHLHVPPSPSLAAMPMASPARALRRSAPGAGAAKKMMAMKKVAPAPQPELLPPRLRYAYLRLRGPDERLRGQLVPLDPTEHLWSLVEDHRTAEIQDLRRAAEALRAAASRLAVAPTPAGTTPLEGASFRHVYDAAGEQSLPSDGDYHRVTLTRFNAPAVIENRTVPRASDDVFRFCRFELPSVPLPEGPLQVYEDGHFRVTSRVTSGLSASPGDSGSLDLNLGVEQALRLLGRTVDVRQEEKGMVAQKSRVEHEVRLRLRSSLREAARVVLYDRLPQPHDDAANDVEVRLLASAPQAIEEARDPVGRKLPGGLRWELDVQAGETVEVTYRYEIALPAKMEIVGGNRRE